MPKRKVASSTKENVNYCIDRFITKTFRAVTLKQPTTKYQQKQYKHEAAEKVGEWGS